MGKKKVKDYLLAAGLTLGITAGAVSGCKMLVDMDQLTTARIEKDKIKNSAVSSETFKDVKESAENALGLVYDFGLISADEHANLGKKINAEDFAYINRDKLVDAQTANAWENAVTSETRELGEMCFSAFTVGSSLSVVGLIAIHCAYKEGKSEETIKKPVEAEEPTL